MRSVVLLRRSLLAAGLTGAGVSATFLSIGSREMADDAVDSLVAVPFTAEIMAGETVNLDVLGQAYAPNVAESVTIEGVSQPASGSVSVINNRIRYTSNSGFAGVDSFTYTLTSNGKSSTATIAITVRSSVSDPQTSSLGEAGPPPGGHSDIPGSTGLWNTVQGINIPALSPTTTHNVSNASQLAAAINTINTTNAAGHHIVLANGSYTGNYTIYAQGTQANPIVIRPATFLGATLTGTLNISGNWVIVRGLRARTINLPYITSPVTRSATNCRISRCILSGAGTLMTAQKGTSYCCFDRNEYIGGVGHVFQILCNGIDSLYNAVVWNLFRDGQPAGDTAASGAEDAIFKIDSYSYSRMNRPQYLLFGWNRFQNATNAAQYQNKMAKGNVIIYNTFKNNASSYAIANRAGPESYFGGNWMSNNSGFWIRGKGHQIIGNRLADGIIRLEPGNIPTGSDGEPTWFAETGTKGWSFAEECRLIGNTGSIRVSGPTGNYPYTPLKNLIENHTGSVTIINGARETIDRRSLPPSQVVPVAYELLASQVGPLS